MRTRVATFAVVSLVASVLVAGTASPQATQVISRPAAIRSLVSRIPKDHRYQCQPLDATHISDQVTAELNSVAAGVTCVGVADLALVWYLQFTDNDALQRVYHAYTQYLSPDTPYREEEAHCPGEVPWGFGDEQDDGLVACYYSAVGADGLERGEVAADVWTYPEAGILAFAVTTAGNPDATTLHQWWVDHAGPLSQRQNPVGFVDWEKPNARAVRSLLAHIPPGIRSKCTPEDHTDADTAFYKQRLWTRATVRCQVGNRDVAYVSMDPVVTDGLFARYTETTAPSDDPDVQCPGTGTWSVGSGKKRHQVGEYACFELGDHVVITWSQRELGIVGSAVAAESFDTLVQWWNGDVGPD